MHENRKRELEGVRRVWGDDVASIHAAQHHWRWDNSLPYFKLHEDHHLGANALHGAKGERSEVLLADATQTKSDVWSSLTVIGALAGAAAASRSPGLHVAAIVPAMLDTRTGAAAATAGRRSSAAAGPAAGSGSSGGGGSRMGLSHADLDTSGAAGEAAAAGDAAAGAASAGSDGTRCSRLMPRWLWPSAWRWRWCCRAPRPGAPPRGSGRSQGTTPTRAATRTGTPARASAGRRGRPTR